MHCIGLFNRYWYIITEQEGRKVLYCISGYVSNRYRYVVLDHDFYQKNEFVCRTCGRTVVSCELQSWPPRMRLEGGSRYPDLLTVSVPFPEKCGMIVSERALSAFRQEGITGFETYPVDFADPIAPGYFFLTVTGSVSLNHQAMHLRKKHVCADCGSFSWSRQKIGESVLDSASWDGSDLCKLTDYPNIFLCTSRVVDVIRGNNLKGFTVRSESEIFQPLKAVKIC